MFGDQLIERAYYLFSCRHFSRRMRYTTADCKMHIPFAQDCSNKDFFNAINTTCKRVSSGERKTCSFTKIKDHMTITGKISLQ